MSEQQQGIGFLVSDVARLLRRSFNRRAEGLGLSQAQWQTLARLSSQEGVNQVTLAESLDIQPVTLARLIDRLQEAGLVARRPDPGDRRAFRLYLTEDAEPLLARMWEFAADIREEALAGLTAEQKRILMDALRRVKQNLLEGESEANRSGGGVSHAAGRV